jgi:hypothetical protein
MMARNKLGLAGTALAGDLGRGATEVHVDVVDRTGTTESLDRLAQHARIASVQLQAARRLTGGEGDHAFGLGAAVHQRGGHHHLVHVQEARCELTAQRTERCVGDPGHGSQHHR